MPDITSKAAPNKTIEQLRIVFTPMTHRLQPEIEPAIVYLPAILENSTHESPKKAEE